MKVLMKKLSNKVIYIVVISMLLGTMVSFAEDLEEKVYGELDKNVIMKIGLTFGNTSVNRVDFASNTGFNMMEYVGSEEVVERKLFDVPFTDLWARKDTAYHVRINKTYNNIDETWKVKKTMVAAGYDAFYRYENQVYLLYVGSYATSGEAETMRQKVANYTGFQTSVVNPTKSDVRIYYGDKILLFYNAHKTDLYFQPITTETKTGFVKYNGKTYRNGLGFNRTAISDMTVINYLHMNEYIYGILPKEMSGSWPLEALKAQAVAARSYAVATSGKHDEHGFDLCTTTDCQVYGGYSVEVDNSNRAVDETDGIYLLYKNKPVVCYFHANSGGATEDPANVWSRGVPYLISVEDPFSLEAPLGNWEKTYTFNEIEIILNRRGKYPGKITRVYAAETAESGRVLKLAIQGSSSTVIIEKNDIRKYFGYTALRSTLFTIESSNTINARSKDAYTTRSLENVTVLSASGKKSFNSGSLVISNGIDKSQKNVKMENVVLKGHGSGHGVGMSQWGAKLMADSGMGYKDILMHYYKNTYFNRDDSNSTEEVTETPN